MNNSTALGIYLAEPFVKRLFTKKTETTNEKEDAE